ncbi:MAG: hypothetical protein ACOC0D_10100 [Spirochaeta sp.]
MTNICNSLLARICIAALITLGIPGCDSIGADADARQSIDWTPYYSRDVAWTSSDWGTPELVTASTAGWEEGVYISGDGSTLYYIYTNVDVFRDIYSGDQVTSGPLLDTSGKATVWADGSSRNAGEYPYADLFYVTRIGDNQWSSPQPHLLTTTRMESVGGIHLIENDNRRIAYVMSGFHDGIDSLYYAYDDGKDGWESWPVDIAGEFTFPGYLAALENIPADSPYEDADPWVNDAGTLLFFWSDRNGTDKDIFYSSNPNDIDSDEWATPEWSDPVRLPSPVNTDGDDMQTFVFQEEGVDYLYYSTNRGARDHGYEIAIYRVRMPTDWQTNPVTMENADNWGDPEPIIYSNFAVGVPGITDDGEFLYFEQIYHDGNNNFNPEIMRVRRQ